MDLLSRGIGMGIGLEPLSCNEAVPINYEQTLFQALVNEGRVSFTSITFGAFLTGSQLQKKADFDSLAFSFTGFKC